MKYKKRQRKFKQWGTANLLNDDFPLEASVVFCGKDISMKRYQYYMREINKVIK